MPVLSTSLQRYVESRDPASFQELVHEYHAMVHGICQRILGRGVEVDDAVQETFIKFARKAGDIRANATAWLHSCARTTALDLQRERKRRGAKEGPLVKDERSTQSAVSERCERSEDTSIVDACLEELSTSDREVVTAYFFVKKTQDEIAEGLGVSQVAIKKRIDKALELLRHKCVRRGLVVPGVMAAFMSNLGAATTTMTSISAKVKAISEACQERVTLHGQQVARWSLASKLAALAIVAVATGYFFFAAPPQGPIAIEAKKPAAPRVVWQPDYDKGLQDWKFTDNMAGDVVQIERDGKPMRALHVKSRQIAQRDLITTPKVKLPRRFALDYDVRELQRMCPFCTLGTSLSYPIDSAVGPTGKMLKQAPTSDQVMNFFPDQWYHFRDEYTVTEQDGKLTFQADNYIDGVFQKSWRADSFAYGQSFFFMAISLEAYIADLRVTALE